MGRLHLTPRQWRIWLVAWLVALMAITGAAAVILLPRLLAPAAHPALGGGVVMGAREVAAPDFTLRDQTGATVSMRQLRGTVLALTFLDTQCQSLCPLQASFLGSAQSDLGSRAPFDVVIISVHPDADTPVHIAAFAGAHGLGHHYYWLTGPLPDLENVWNGYGVAVQAAQGDLAHSSVIYLIDRSGYERVGFEDVPETAAFETDVQILNAS